MEVYRYLDYKYFLELVEKKKLRFVNPLTAWVKNDDKEGYLFQLAKSDPNAVYDGLDVNNALKDVLFTQLKQGGLFREENNDWFAMRCQCWSKSRNSPRMWEEYSKDNTSVCICVDLQNLTELRFKNQKVEAMEVIYKDTLEIQEELECVCRETGELFFPLVFQPKRKSYAFEDEYRLYISLLDQSGHKVCDEDVVNIPIDMEMTSFINDVLLDPSMNGTLRDEIHDYCHKKGLSCSDT